MKWNEIKNSIVNDLKTRGLSNPKIRLSALNNLEEILKQNFSEYVNNPQEMFGQIDKNKFKEKVSKYKSNQKLNSAESSIINEIYYRI